jgi:predicted transposase YdaD
MIKVRVCGLYGCADQLVRFQFEQEGQMSYITTAEQIGHARGREEGRVEGREEGRVEGLIDGIMAILEIRFGDASAELMDAIQPITDVPTLERLLQAAKTAHTLDH